MSTSEVAVISEALNDICNGDDENELEFWLARDLMSTLGYKTWESFSKVIVKAQEACANAGISEENHFRQATKKVQLGSGATREVEDVMLSRFACFLVAQNGDPQKTQIAVAQAYFAVQTRKAEVIEQHYRSIERLEHRDQLRASEKLLSETFNSHGVDGASFGIIRSKGDKAFFGGNTTQDMKDLYGIQKSRPLGDFLSPLVMSAKTLINEMSRHNISHDGIDGEMAVTKEHVSNSKAVRETLRGRGIKPEDLPPEEDIKKVQKRVDKEIGSLPSQALPAPTD